MGEGLVQDVAQDLGVGVAVEVAGTTGNGVGDHQVAGRNALAASGHVADIQVLRVPAQVESDAEHERGLERDELGGVVQGGLGQEDAQRLGGELVLEVYAGPLLLLAPAGAAEAAVPHGLTRVAALTQVDDAAHGAGEEARGLVLGAADDKAGSGA